VAILLGDMPWVESATLDLLARVASGSTIVLPCHAGRQGHPVLFGRDFWPALARLKGDEGARSVLKTHADRCVRLDVEDAGVLQDVDSPDALRQ